jgi:hypothetical protein
MPLATVAASADHQKHTSQEQCARDPPDAMEPDSQRLLPSWLGANPPRKHVGQSPSAIGPATAWA